ncbi:prepilin-type N-terminal cleavage/methylation domain-containing protein [Candidatus Microgenomates bacterium]|nr:prepilin-type N-terminal cleavage/methylation domain-containing protein [Candidatus Microgenomates bacterium]
MKKGANAGFTIVEVLVVIFVLTLIIGLPMIFLWGIGRSDALNASTREVVGVLGEAQTNTISGLSKDGQEPSVHGIYFSANYYVMFKGTTYDVNDSQNERTDLPLGITFSQIQLPQSSVVFDRVSGSIANYDPAQNFVVVLETNTQKSKTITISKTGGISY